MSAEWEFLVALNERLRPLKDAVEIQEAAVRLVGEQLHANRVHYAHIDDDDFVIIRSYVDGVPHFAARVPIARYGAAIVSACRRGETVAVDSVQIDPRFTEGERQQLLAEAVAAFVGIPLIKDGRWIAAFSACSANSRVWTRADVAFIEMAAQRMWGAGERERVEAALDRSENRQAFLRRLNDTIRPIASPTRVLDDTCRLLCIHLGVDRVAYGEADGDDYVVVGEYADGLPSLPRRFPWRGLAGSRTTDILKGRTLSVNDTSVEAHTVEERTELQAAGIGAYITPLLVKDGRLVGSFGVHSRAPRIWTIDEIALVEEVADRIWTTLEHRRAEAELRANEERLAFLLRLNDALRPLSDPNEVLEAAARLLGEHLDVTRVGYVEVADRAYVIRYEHTRGVAPLSTHGLAGGWGAALRDSYLRGETVVVGDVTSDPRFDESERITLQGRQIAAFIGVTLIKGGRMVAAFGANHATPRQWTPTEIALVRDVAERTWEAVERARAEAALRARRDEERNSERERAAAALRARTVELEYRTRQLSQMAWDLTLAEHHAREQIARTLHDGLQQLLVIAVLNLEQQLKRERDSGGAPSDLLAEAKYHLDEAIAAARSLHLELFPPVLQRSGLPAALTWLASWARDKYKLNVVIDADPTADSPRKDVRTLLFESVRELLFNAFKYARADRVTLTLRAQPDDQLCVTVTDNGVGFEPAKLDDRSKAGQVGWGLFSIRERLTLLGGSVDLDSAPTRGTRVRLVTPRGAALTAGNGTGITVSGMTPAVDIGRAALPDALRILIVDDHAAVRKTLREMLQERPQLSVIGDASNGFEAIADAHALRPDVILMDLAMPQMDGIEAAARIRAELPDIQIVLMSMQAGSEMFHAIERTGAVGFFAKGSDTNRMIDFLTAVHASRRARQRASS